MDLEIKDVANLLNVSEETVKRWLAEGHIPAYRMNDQYRFSRLEIEDWLLHREQRKNSDSLEAPASRSGPQHFCLYRALHQGDIFKTVQGKTKEEVIRFAVHAIAPKLGLDPDMLSELLLDREALMSTGLGQGVAVPHTREFSRKFSIDHIFVVYPETPLPYGSLDGQEVHTLFFLFASNDKCHLQLLAKLAHLANQQGVPSFLQGQPSKKELLEFVRRWEDGAYQPSALLVNSG